MIDLIEYVNEQAEMKKLIKQFWLSHNHIDQSDEEIEKDVKTWTKEGHRLFFIRYLNDNVGFLHLGNRGAEINWLEHIFVLAEFQGKGIGSKAIEKIESIVKTYSDSLYIEAAARNQKAINLYRKLGYDCLNTISVRKDFDRSKLCCIGKETLFDYEFEIRKVK